MKPGIQTKGGETLDRTELTRRLAVRARLVDAVSDAVGPTSLRDLATAVGVNRQTIMNALESVRQSQKATGRPPAARTKLAESIDDVLARLSKSDQAAILRGVAAAIEAGAWSAEQDGRHLV